MENFNLNELGIEELEDLIEDAWALKEVRKEELKEANKKKKEEMAEANKKKYI
jgi:hypothetical protein